MEYCHNWTLEEELFCCRKYIWYMFTQAPKTEDQLNLLMTFDEYREMLELKNARELVAIIGKMNPFIGEKEIGLELRRIKYVSCEHGDDGVLITPRKVFRPRLREIFWHAFDVISCELNHETPPILTEEIIEERIKFRDKIVKNGGDF